MKSRDASRSRRAVLTAAALAVAACGEDTVEELFTSRPDGSGNAVVSGPLVPSGGVVNFEWMGALRLVYRADQLVGGRFELFTAAPDGDGSAVISGPLVDGGDVFAFSTN